MRWVSDMKVKGSLWSCLRVKNCSFRTHLEVLECSGQKAKKVLLSVMCSAKCKQTQQLLTLCKRMQQLPTMLGPAVHHGKDTAHKTLETMCNAHVCPQQCWKAVQTDPTLLRYASAITEQIRMLRSCWLKSLTCFKLCSTTHNNLQQGVQTDAHCEIQQCWELLANNVACICLGL